MSAKKKSAPDKSAPQKHSNHQLARHLRDERTGRLKKASTGIEAAVSDSARLLKDLRLEAGLSVRAMAAKLNLNPTSYQHYEGRYKKAFLPFEFVELVQPILLAGGVRLLHGAVEDGTDAAGLLGGELEDGAHGIG